MAYTLRLAHALSVCGSRLRSLTVPVLAHQLVQHFAHLVFGRHLASLKSRTSTRAVNK